MIDARITGSISQVIDLSNLDLQIINQLISCVLNMEKEITEPLASVVFAKSAGNPHYAIEILKTIEKQKLIHFSSINFRWEWDLPMIQSTIDVSDNIVEIILSRISTLPPQIQKTLILGSCFGPK
jgi:predicted ATPase